MKIYKIYCLKNPNNLKIRYIGVTTSKYLSTRLSQHYYSANHNHQTHVAKWIRSINTKPIIELIEVCNRNNWELREKYWINYYNDLTNIHEGGKGVIVDRKKSSVDRSAQAHEISIVQLDINGNFIKKWNSLKKATIYFNGKSLGSISNVLKKRYGANTAFGYKWVYYNEYKEGNYSLRIQLPKVNYNKIKKVYLFDSNNILIKEYLSLNILSKELGCAYSSARKALKNNKLLYNKYYLRNYKI